MMMADDDLTSFHLNSARDVDLHATMLVNDEFSCWEPVCLPGSSSKYVERRVLRVVSKRVDGEENDDDNNIDPPYVCTLATIHEILGNKIDGGPRYQEYGQKLRHATQLFLRRYTVWDLELWRYRTTAMTTTTSMALDELRALVISCCHNDDDRFLRSTIELHTDMFTATTTTSGHNEEKQQKWAQRTPFVYLAALATLADRQEIPQEKLTTTGSGSGGRHHHKPSLHSSNNSYYESLRAQFHDDANEWEEAIAHADEKRAWQMISGGISGDTNAQYLAFLTSLLRAPALIIRVAKRSQLATPLPKVLYATAARHNKKRTAQVLPTIWPVQAPGFLKTLINAVLAAPAHRMIEPDTVYVHDITRDPLRPDVVGGATLKMGDFWVAAAAAGATARVRSSTPPPGDDDDDDRLLDKMCFWTDTAQNAFRGCLVPGYCTLPRVAVECISGTESAAADPLVAQAGQRMQMPYVRENNMRSYKEHVSSVHMKRGMVRAREEHGGGDDKHIERQTIWASLCTSALGELVFENEHDTRWSLSCTIHQLAMLSAWLGYMGARLADQLKMPPPTRQMHQYMQTVLFGVPPRQVPELTARVLRRSHADDDPEIWHPSGNNDDDDDDPKTVTNILKKELGVQWMLSDTTISTKIFDGFGPESCMRQLMMMRFYNDDNNRIFAPGFYTSPRTQRTRRRHHGDLARILNHNPRANAAARALNSLRTRTSRELHKVATRISGGVSAGKTTTPQASLAIVFDVAFTRKDPFELIRRLWNLNPDQHKSPPSQMMTSILAIEQEVGDVQQLRSDIERILELVDIA